MAASVAVFDFFGREYKLRPSLCTCSFCGTGYENSEILVLHRWIPVTETHPKCPTPKVGMWPVCWLSGHINMWKNLINMVLTRVLAEDTKKNNIFFFRLVCQLAVSIRCSQVPLVYKWICVNFYFQDVSQSQQKIVCPGKVSALAISPDGLFCTAGISDKVYIWEVSITVVLLRCLVCDCYECILLINSAL